MVLQRLHQIKQTKMANDKNLLYQIGHFVADKFNKVGSGGGSSVFDETFAVTNQVGSVPGSIVEKTEVTTVVRQMLTKTSTMSIALKLNEADGEYEKGTIVTAKKLVATVKAENGKVRPQNCIFYSPNGSVLGTVTYTGNELAKDGTYDFVYTLNPNDVYGNSSDFDFSKVVEYAAQASYTNNNEEQQTTAIAKASYTWPLNTLFYGYIEAVKNNANLTLPNITENHILSNKMKAVPGLKSTTSGKYTITSVPKSVDGKNYFLCAAFPKYWNWSGNVIMYASGSPMGGVTGITQVVNVRKWRDNGAKSETERKYKEDYTVIIFGSNLAPTLENAPYEFKLNS